MATPAYNKVTRQWVSTNTGLELTPPENWIINPQFANEADAREMGEDFWTFSNDTIITPSRDAYTAAQLVKARDRKWRGIQAERDRRTQGGVLVAGKWFHSDQASRIQQLGMVIMGASLPVINWKTMDGSFITMTPQLAMGIFQSVAVKDTQIFTIAEMRRGAMMAVADPETYDHLGGSPAWPSVFGD